MSLNSAKKKLITAQSKANFEAMVLAFKERLGDINYITVAEHLAEKTGLPIDKDAIWRTATGNYTGSPSYLALYALSQEDAFYFLRRGPNDSWIHPTLEQIHEVLLGRLDAYGQPIEQAIENPAE